MRNLVIFTILLMMSCHDNTSNIDTSTSIGQNSESDIDAAHKELDHLKSSSFETPDEFVQYLMPNAVSIRFTESGDLLNLHHKLKSRLCYNAQEEIWQASLDELEQITAINPGIGQYLLPPCGLRHLSKRTPYCPEGDRYCGVPVWRLSPSNYERMI